MNEEKGADSEVLLERVREFEAAKREEKTGDKENTAHILGEKRKLSEPLSENEAKRRMSHRSRRSFLIGGATALAGIFGWRWMSDDTKNALLHRASKFNETVSQTFFGNNHLAPEFARARPRTARQRR